MSKQAFDKIKAGLDEVVLLERIRRLTDRVEALEAALKEITTDTKQIFLGETIVTGPSAGECQEIARKALEGEP